MNFVQKPTIVTPGTHADTSDNAMISTKHIAKMLATTPATFPEKTDTATMIKTTTTTTISATNISKVASIRDFVSAICTTSEKKIDAKYKITPVIIRFKICLISTPPLETNVPMNFIKNS